MPFPPAESTFDTNILVASGTLDPGAAFTELRLQDGRAVRISTATLLQSADAGQALEAPLHEHEGRIILPLAEEQLHVGKRVVKTGTVHLHKSVQTFETSLDEVLAVRSFDVERVVLNQPVESAPTVRQEGDTTIYSLVEEQLVVTRQLILKEELHVTQRDTERRDTRPVMLRREVIEVEREPMLQPKVPANP